MVAGEGDLSPADRVTVLYFLASDHDREVREGARKALAEIPEHDLRQAVSSPDLHPRVLNALARLYHRFHHLAESLATHPNCDDATRDFLSGKGIVVFSPNSGNVSAHQEEGETGEEDFAETDEPVDEESEAFRSKYQLAQTMGVAEKIKIAQTGDKEWRMILIKDSNKLVSGTVIRNPRMTESEVLTIAKSAIQNDEILRVICANKEWVKNYQIRKALVENTKTPLPTSLRLLATLGEKDLAHIAKSKNISSVLSTQAKKLVMAKKKD
ncbi:hypothetical protein GPICK_08915 [Geobacter pickeringii]|uniref:Uncharacterized protein n=2 Tax=Geobacter pickeringii TaxID=345632 RepID=A0A0B5BDU6_9BACT|nr:hypothetical protein GPICK_08915 [Geobacter pickeringii]